MDANHGLTIVAIPEKDDYVWRISSEKVPHLTLLYLGGTDLSGRAQQYISHVVSTTLSRFGLSVDHRGVLGAKDADVIFFSPLHQQMLENFRGYLLDDGEIKDAYNSVQQYPEYTPHMTLGYPETPAKPDTREYPGINWVRFDRIALWTSDYEGPEFMLENNDALDAVRMTDAGGQFLKHYGVLGMHWGVHKPGTHSHNGPHKARPKVPGPSKDHTDVAKAREKIKAGGVQAVSDKELQQVVKRMNLEQQYAGLVQREPTRLKKGAAAIKGIIGVTKTAVDVYNLTNSAAFKAGAAVISAAIAH